MHITKLILGALCVAAPALAHMEMIKPYALRSQYDPANDWSNIDYDNTSPLSSSGSNFPCRSHHTSTPWRTVATYRAGQRATVEFAPGNQHKGGSCQLSLSYDNGGSFKVIHSIIGGCPLSLSYDFTIPAFAPSGRALFAWTWFNLEGNREMYMNCAQVEIQGGSGGGGSGEWNALPEIFEANIGNGCSTVEHRQTVFAQPGQSVVYGAGLGPNSPVFPNC